jgi:immune inhibitor A
LYLPVLMPHMKRFISLGLLLLFAGLVACSGSATVAPTANPEATVQAEPNTLNPVGRATATPEPRVKVLPAHEEPNTARQFIDAADRDLFRLTRELVPGTEDIQRTVAGDATDFSVGRTDTFWLVDLANTETYQSEFRLALVTPHAYWYVEHGLDLSLSDLERSASRFEEDIYPVVTRVFGSEWSPGIDNDPRLNILNAKLSGVAGYFSSTDEYPTSVRPRSNQREIIYINALNVPPGGINYDQVLAHELQHAIHWNADASEDTWVNEGLAELSSSIALQSTFSIRQFLRGAPISLVNWPTSSVGSINNYGAASLFMHFLTEHYGGQDDLRDLLGQQGDSIAGIDRYLEDKGYDARFEDVFREWAAANILDKHLDPSDAIMGYEDLDVIANVSKSISGYKEARSEIPQYAVEYTELKSISKPFELSFKGQTTTELLPIDVGPAGCWWSNSGDSIDSTLSHRFDIPSGATAALEYEIWYEIEEDWDYVYVEVSVNGGKTWQIMDTPETTPENPIGNGFGPGYTGASHGWLTDSVDLSSFAGKDIWVRFQYVTDDAINAAGACFRNLTISSPGMVAVDEGWEAQGFVFTDDIVRQYFQVQLITAGENPTVRQLILDANNEGKFLVQPPEDEERLIVAVGSLAEKTRQPASYTLSLTPGGLWTGS